MELFVRSTYISVILLMFKEISMLLSFIFLWGLDICSFASELYEIYDQELFLDHNSKQLKHHHMIGLFPSCEEATPFIKLTAQSTNVGYSQTPLDNERLHHAQIVALAQKTNSLLAANPYSPFITASIGWLDFTIFDIMVHKTNISQSLLCYDGEVRTYATKPCPNEERGYPSTNRIEFLGGNGYDFHMVSEGNARYWSPVRDNRDGSYSVRVRVDDPGLYRIDLLLNNRQGCQYADCNVPRDICDTFLDYGPRVEFCKIAGNCVKNISSFYISLTDSDQWPPYKHTLPGGKTSYALPNCSVYEMGAMPGRWLSPSYMLERYEHSVPPFHNPQEPYPFVWQPYDCQLHWLSVEEVKSCVSESEIIISGFSRERTNFFDIFDFQQKPIPYHKLMNTDTVENINYFSTYHGEVQDRKHWNHNAHLVRTTNWIADDLKSSHICLTPQQYADALANLRAEMASKTDPGLVAKLNATYQQVERKQRSRILFLLTEEHLWTVEMGQHSIWHELSKDFIKHFAEQCSGKAIVYKTSSALRSQFGSLSWQRFFLATRISAKNARALQLPILDSFIMTQPWIMDTSIFPDGLHLFSSTRFQGNWVSKTVSMIFMAQACRKN